MEFLAPLDAFALGRGAIEIQSPLAVLDAKAALAAQDGFLSAAPGCAYLAISIREDVVQARYAVADADGAATDQRLTLRGQFVGRLAPSNSGCMLRGRFVLPYFQLVALVAAISVLFNFLPPFSSLPHPLEMIVGKLWLGAIIYVGMGIPTARTDVPFIERNLRYALTGSNDS